MGYRVLLIAVRRKDAAKIHADFGVHPTDDFEEIAESPVTGAWLPNGDYLLYINDDIMPDDRVLAKLSSGASLLACYANETTMDSFLASWVAGREEWSVWHDAQQSLRHLEIRGTVPAELAPIRERLTAQQMGVPNVDYTFDIPIEMFVALGGIRYNEDIPNAEPAPWRVLQRVRAKKGWWLFG
jgi:hypothetical protein